jgi:uncharacterized protein YndB with AHSA1/START domain
MQWWGPHRFTARSAKMDFREGGTSLVCMRAPKEFGGQDMYSTWAYKKIVPMQSIEFIHNLADKDGRVAQARRPETKFGCRISSGFSRARLLTQIYLHFPSDNFPQLVRTVPIK